MVTDAPAVPATTLAPEKRRRRRRKSLIRDIDVQAPIIGDDPLVQTGALTKAPMELPPNLAVTIPSPFPFAYIAIWHHPFPLGLLVGLFGFSLYEWFFLTTRLPLLVAVFLPLLEITAMIFVPAWVATKVATRRAIVIYKDPAGRTEVDGEYKMWWTDARKWSDAWRWPFETRRGSKKKMKRVTMIDALDYDFAKPDKAMLFPFQPWLAPVITVSAGLDARLAAETQPGTPARIGYIWAVGKAVRGWLDVRDVRSELMSMFILAVLIGGAILAMFVAGDYISATLKDSAQARAANAAADFVGDRLEQQVQEQLRKMIDTGEIVIKDVR